VVITGKEDASSGKEAGSVGRTTDEEVPLVVLLREYE